MSAIITPLVIYQTQRRMDDYSADDMRYGDLSGDQLRNQFNLRDVSMRVNPYTFQTIENDGFFNKVYDANNHNIVISKIGKVECAQILFDEFRHLSSMFAFRSPYAILINKMITHMQFNDGAPYNDPLLNDAIREQILEDDSDNSSLLKIRDVFNKSINWNTRSIKDRIDIHLVLKSYIGDSVLPKFDRLEDRVNGLGITVHDTWSTTITLQKLEIYNDYCDAIIHYKIQDHFGLDSNDIMSALYHNFRFFRIWFVLQRYDKLGFKPFMTDMEATINIKIRSQK